MQNRYAGDIGDFGKLGLLRALRAAGLSLGVNWYLVPDEKHNQDGKFTEYEDLRVCDEALWDELKAIVDSDRREVEKLQKKSILDAVFYREVLDFSGKTKTERAAVRNAWHKAALETLADVDVVFADPDNGLIVPSAAKTKRENKYVLPKELEDCYNNGSTVVYYQHQARLGDPDYLEKHRTLIDENSFDGASALCLKFNKTSHRYYFFIIQPRHEAIIKRTVSDMLSSDWKNCFEQLKV